MLLALRPSRIQATSLFRRRPGTQSAPWWPNWSASTNFPSDWVSMAIIYSLQGGFIWFNTVSCGPIDLEIYLQWGYNLNTNLDSRIWLPNRCMTGCGSSRRWGDGCRQKEKHHSHSCHFATSKCEPLFYSDKAGTPRCHLCSAQKCRRQLFNS